MEAKNVSTVREAHRAFNRRDFDAVATKLAEDFIYHDRARGLTFRGRDGFKEFMQGWVMGFSNAEVTEATYIDAGDSVIAQFVARGVNDGPLEQFPPSGREMTVHFCELFRFDGRGQVISGEVYYDQLSMISQLGHGQPAAHAASA